MKPAYFTHLGNRGKGILMSLFGVFVLSPDSLMIRLAGLDDYTLIFYRGLFPAIAITLLLWFYYRDKLIPALLAFALLVGTTVLAGTLAVRQDAKALAVLGIIGGFMGASLVKWTPMTTPDLLLACAILLAVTLGLNLYMARLRLYEEVESGDKPVVAGAGWRTLIGNRYIVLIGMALFCAQLASPVVDYQFLSAVEAAFPA